jgi:lipid A ethanolaminephosphotransferase
MLGNVRLRSLFSAPAPDPDSTPAWRLTLPATVDQLVVVASLFWALTVNRRFLAEALQGRAYAAWDTWGFAIALMVILVAVHVLLLAPVANRWTVKPLLAVLTVAAALASHYMQAFGVYLDPGMVRNVLRTNAAEGLELLSWTLVPHLLVYAGLPLLLLWRVRVVRHALVRSALVRVVTLLVAAAAAVGALLAIYQPLASLIRNHKEVRYLVTPANLLWALGSVVHADTRGAVRPRQPIGLDAAPGERMQRRQRPLVVVMVVGETARTANWGLSGYARQTTPRLAELGVINFAEVTACGTNTEVSLPCMFAPVGRRRYDEATIGGSESLLHVAARAGVGVHWLDNQLGCKGVCDGLPSETIHSRSSPGLCENGRCLDEALLQNMDARLSQARGTQLWVLHPLGNHGPSYFRRYPAAFARFQPECRHDDLRQCSVEEIVNAYDNALLYTDHVLAGLIAKLRARENDLDAVLLYVSDHGESLGEKGMFLHGVPYPIAPSEQTRVPMVMWATQGAAAAVGVSWDCLRRRAAEPARHDHLFHTLLGVLDVRTSVYEAAWDLTRACRQ